MRYAWSTYWKNVGPMLIIMVVIAAISLVVNFIGQAADEPAVAIIFAILGWLVAIFLALGLIRAALAVTAGETPEVNMLFKTEGFGPYIVASIIFGIATAIGYMLCILPGIFIAIIWWFYGYAIVDEGVDNPMEALKRSAQLTQGNRGALFVLGLALLGINIVGVLLCGVGLLFTAGISAIAVAHAFRTLKGQPIAPAA